MLIQIPHHPRPRMSRNCSPTWLQKLLVLLLLRPGIGSGCGNLRDGDGLMPSGMVADKQNNMQMQFGMLMFSSGLLRRR